MHEVDYSTGTVAASSTQSVAYGADKAFDADSGIPGDSKWAAVSGTNEWIQISFPEAIRVLNFQIFKGSFPGFANQYAYVPSDDGKKNTL
jgi:hypothetical protein